MSLELRVRGSGFRLGSRVYFALNGDTTFAASRVRTHGTTFVGPTEVRASITIEADAPVALLDVGVTVPGGGGVVAVGMATGLFEVTPVPLRVHLAEPARTPRNTTLEVIVSGTGFEQGAEVFWALRGDSAFATTRVRTAHTTYVSSTEVRALVSTEPDAPLALYDVGVRLPDGGQAGRVEIADKLFEIVYERVDLGFDGEARAINERGQVVGWRFNGAGAFLWEAGALIDLGAPDGFRVSYAHDINEASVVAGYSLKNADDGSCSCGGSGPSTAWIWTAERGFTVLPTLGGTDAWASGISESGLVVGTSTTADGTHRAVLWRDGVAIDLHTLDGGASEANDVNDAGVVVGVYWPDSYTSRSFRWTESGGMELITETGAARHVAASGEIVGRVAGAAYLWKAGTLSMVPLSDAWAMNRDGVVVGGAGVSWHAAMWQAQQGQTFLDGRNPPSGQAYGINGLGWVVGTRGSRATLWKTIP